MSSAASRRKGRADWLPDILSDAGIPFQVMPGFHGRGKTPVEWLAVVPHHTASNPRGGAAPSMPLLVNGRGGPSPVPGPLCNWSTGRDGIVRLVADGAANHPGVATLELPGRKPITSGVKYYALGDEIELSGVGEPFPTGGRQYEVAHRTYAAVCLYLGLDPATAIQDHKTIARPVGRKIDVHPYDLATGRRRVQHLVDLTRPGIPTPTPPASEDHPMATTDVDRIITEIQKGRPYAVRAMGNHPEIPHKSVWICTAMTRRRPTREDLNWCYFTGQVQAPAAGPGHEPHVPPSLIAGLHDITPQAA